MPKGTTRHRIAGWTFVTLMVVVSVTAFFIHELRLWGRWSPIHLLAIFTLAMLPLAILYARRHRVPNHKRAMVNIFLGALVVAGLFTLLPAASCTRCFSGLESGQKTRRKDPKMQPR